MMGEAKWLKIVAHDDDLLEAVKRYIGEAEPTDDITLMTIQKKRAAQPISVCVPNHIEQWPSLRRTLHEYGVCTDIEKHTLKKLEIALEEAVVNIISYSHATEIELKIQRSTLNAPRNATLSKIERSSRSHTLTERTLNITLTDNGVPFDPTSSECDTAKIIEERQMGGLGISLLRQITDEQHYQRTDERNQLTIIKYL
jgi:serine/threonine-protein kinase RsbW